MARITSALTNTEILKAKAYEKALLFTMVTACSYSSKTLALPLLTSGKR
jgi:hypothetical protein